MSAAGGGGGGTPLKILFQILGISEAKTAIASIAPDIEKIGQAADAVSGKLSSMSGSISKSADGIAPVSKNLDTLKTSGESAASGIEKVSTSMDTTKTASTGAADSYTKYTAEGTKAKQSTDQLVTSVDKSAVSTKTSTQNTDQLSASQTKSTVETTKSSKSITDLGGSQDKTSKSTKDLGGSQDKLSGSTKSTTGILNEEKGSLDQVTDSNEKTTGATKKNEEGHKNLKSSFLATMGAATSLVGGVTSLWQSYDSLGDAQLALDKATLKYNQAQEAASKAHAKVNLLVAQGKTGTEEYKGAVLDAEQADTKSGIAKENQTNAQEGLNLVNADFYKNIGPEMISIIGSIATMIATTQGLTGVLGDRFVQLRAKGTDSLIKLKFGVTSVREEMTLLGLTNPFFIALTAGGFILTAFVTNMFGFRDAINSVGVALGKAVEPLKPLLTMVGQLGEGLVKGMGMGGDAAKAYGATTEGAMNQASGAVEENKGAFTTWQQVNSQVLRDADGRVAGFTDDFLVNMGTAGGAMTGLSDSVKQSTDQSSQYFSALVQDSLKTAEKLKNIFSQTISLHGLEVSGLQPGKAGSHQFGSIPEEVTGEGGHHFGFGTGLSSFADIGKQGVDVVTDGFGKAYLSAVQLDKALKALNITGAAHEQVLQEIVRDLHITLLAQNTNVSGLTGLTTATNTQMEAEKNGGAWIMRTVATQKTAKGTTQALMSAEEQRTNAVNNSTAATQKQASGIAAFIDQTQKSAEELRKNTEITSSAANMESVRAAGFTRQQALMQQNIINLEGNVGATQEYSKQLDSQQGVMLEVAQGAQKQTDALNQAKASMLGNIGALLVLQEATTNGSAQTVAWTNSYLQQRIALENSKIAIAGVQGETAALTEQLLKGEIQIVTFNKGFTDQEKQIKLDTLAVIEMQGKVKAMSDEWQTGEAQLVAFNTGLEKQALQFEEDKKHSEELKGTIAELITEWNSGEAASVAFNNAFQEQELLAQKNMVSNEALKGTLSGLIKQYAEGTTTFNAFNKGFTEQEISIYKNAEAADQLTGTIAALDSEWSNGLAPLGAFIKAYYEQELAFRNSAVASEALKGTVAALANELSIATTADQNFTKGQEEQRKSILESYMSYQTLIGSTIEYHNAIQTGLPQRIAYNVAIGETRKALDDMKVAIGTATGVTNELFKQLTSLDGVNTRYNLGLVQGREEIVKWAGGLDTARGAMDGTLSTLSTVADKLGVVLPEGIKLSVAGWKDFIEGMKGGPEAMQKNLEKLDSLGESIGSGLVDAMKKGKKAVKDEFEKLGDETGLDFDKGMQESLERAKIGEHLLKQIQTSVGVLDEFKLEPESFNKVADQISQNVAEAVQRDPGMARVGDMIQTTLAKLKINPGDTAAYNRLVELVAALGTSGNLAGVGVDALTNASARLNPAIATGTTNLQNVNQAFSAYKASLGNIDVTNTLQAFQNIVAQAEAAQKAIRAYNDANKVSFNQGLASGDTRFQEDLQVSGGIVGGAPIGGGGGAGGDQFATQTQSLEAFKTALATLPLAAKTATDGMNTAFATLNPILATMGQAIALIGSQLIPAAFTAAQTAVTTSFQAINTSSDTVIVTMGQAFALLGTQLIPAAFTAASTAINTSFQEMNTLSNTVIVTMGQAFALLGSQLIPAAFRTSQAAVNTSFQAMNTVASNMLATIGKAAVLLGGQLIPTAFRTAENAVNISFQSMNTKATFSLKSMGTGATVPQQQITQAFRTAENAVNTSFQSMQTKAQYTLSSISSSVGQATNAVKQLASAINSLKDKTVTITTVHRNVTTYAASGFGPAIVDHPLNMKVGEAGPEYVSVIPLSSGGSKNLSPDQRLSMFADPGKMRKNVMGSVSAGQNFATGISSFNTTFGNNTNSVNNNVSQVTSLLNRFTESVSKITNAFNIVNASSVRGGTSSSVFTDNRSANIPNISNVNSRGGTIINNGGNGGSIDGILSIIKDMVLSAFGQTTINLNNVTNIDSEKVYDHQKKQFGLRNGSMFK